MSHKNKSRQLFSQQRRTNKKQVEGISKRRKINKTRIGVNDQEEFTTLEQQIIQNKSQIWCLVQQLNKQNENLDQEQVDASNNQLLKALNKYLFETMDLFFPKPDDIRCSNYHSQRKRR